MPLPERQCSRCLLWLPIPAFGYRPRAADGISGVCRACEVERSQVRKHGMTTLERAEIVKTYDGCATCGRTTPGSKGWVIDHDHTCHAADSSCESCRRGVLCQWCNTALGMALDDPATLRRLADYVELGTRLGR